MPVTVYTRSTCAPCRMLKAWLTHKNIPYKELNVDDDPALVDQVVKLSGRMMVPFTIVGEDNYVSGLNLSLLSKLLML